MGRRKNHSWVSPTGHEDPGNAWNNEGKAYDENTATAADSVVPAYSWSLFLVLTHASIDSDKVRFWGGYTAATDIDLDVYDGVDWHHVYEGPYTSTFTWVEKSFTERSITKVRVRLKQGGMMGSVWFYELDFWEVPPPPAAGGEAALYLTFARPPT